MMQENSSSYRQIFKSTGIFGGVQVMVILIGIIKTKFLAVWLGAAGIGIIGLLVTPLTMITTLTGLGLSTSAVREISAARQADDPTQLAKTVRSVKNLAKLTALAALILTIIFSPILSRLSFGNGSYTLAFMALAITVFFTNISASQNAILQGTRHTGYMAKSTIIGAAAGLIISLPLYYLYGTDGIVPALVLASFSAWLTSWFYSGKAGIPKIKINFWLTIKNGTTMVKLGSILALSALIGSGIRYVISIFISQKGGIDQVGLYQAGFTLIISYIGIVFTAMGTDYFPRLSACKTNEDSTRLINQQTEMALLVITPICMMLLITLPIVIRVLYSSQFMGTVPMVEWVLLSVILKTVVWTIGFLFLAKGAYGISFKVDNLTNIIFVVGYIGLYSIMGLQGIGIADLILYASALMLSYYIAHKKYQFVFYKSTLKILAYGFTSVAVLLLIFKIYDRSPVGYGLAAFLFLLISALSVKSLSHRLNFNLHSLTLLTKTN